MKKIIILSTGGTIAMKYDEKIGANVPAVSGKELIAAIPSLKDAGDIEVVEFSNIPSPHMTPKLMLDLRDKIDELLEDETITGLVVTHGTDTLEETAYFLDLTLKTDKPVVLTAAMRSADEIGSDGPVNLLSSVRTAADFNSKAKGVLVVLNQQVHKAKDVTKTHTGNIDTFKSPFWGPIGYVDTDKIIWNNIPIREERYSVKSIEIDDVHLVKMTAGASSLIIDTLVENNVSGIVIEAFGRGNVPPNIMTGIEKAIEKKIPLVISSRCLGGRPLGIYGYAGGGGTIANLGGILAGDLNGQKARIKLIVALNSENYKYENLNKYFDN
ncbi:MAG TPA: asparaginase [Clostridiaceae bacterium]|nr:asparaginase [Clostridiaceae bacterium]